MALIKCSFCERYMGAGVSQCIYCGKPLDAGCSVVGTEQPPNTSPKMDRKSKKNAEKAVLLVFGLLLAGIGSVLSAVLPLVGIPTMLAGGWMLLKAQRLKK